MREQLLLEAKFDPKVKLYWYLQGLALHFVLVFAGIGLVTLPIWAVLGLVIVSKRFDALSCQLKERSIHLRSGAMNRVEKTIPLEKIQDLSLRTGPLLNAFGLASIQVETAGSSNPQGADMSLPGLVNAEAFRNAVLEQREKASGVVSAVPAADDPTIDRAAHRHPRRAAAHREPARSVRRGIGPTSGQRARTRGLTR